MVNNGSVVIVAAKRTAIGKFGGGLASVQAHVLSSVLMRNILQEQNLAPEQVAEVILGHVLVAGERQNPARQASIAAGIPVEVPAWMVNQVCGSGLKALMLACNNILQAQAQGAGSYVVIAGGQENMSRVPFAADLRFNSQNMGDKKLKDLMIYDGLTDAFSLEHMGITAENLAAKYQISREEQDEFAVASHNKAENAHNKGFFSDEIVEIEVNNGKSSSKIASDETIRLGSNIEAMRKLKPAFKTDGTVTAGNASSINDGAAILLLMSEAEAQRRGMTPIARIVSYAQAGVEPSIMGIGPVPATRKALEAAGWRISDLDSIELNEAFAAQAIAVNRELSWDSAKVNPCGGAIALGHPIGASGARILTTLIHNLRRRGGGRGLASLCVGGGMGVAMCVELLG